MSPLEFGTRSKRFKIKINTLERERERKNNKNLKKINFFFISLYTRLYYLYTCLDIRLKLIKFLLKQKSCIIDYSIYMINQTL